MAAPSPAEHPRELRRAEHGPDPRDAPFFVERDAEGDLGGDARVGGGLEDRDDGGGAVERLDGEVRPERPSQLGDVAEEAGDPPCAAQRLIPSRLKASAAVPGSR
mgnify:CR=1 FL=1